MHGPFVRETPVKVCKDKTWQWNRRLEKKIGTEAVQEQTIRTNYVKNHIEKTIKNPLCRLCEKKR